jgi:hypothetical protein
VQIVLARSVFAYCLISFAAAPAATDDIIVGFVANHGCAGRSKATDEPKHVQPEDFERFREAGLSDPEILEALEISAWFNRTNRIFNSLGVIPEEKYFGR